MSSPGFSPVAQITDPSSIPTVPEERMTEEQLNALQASSVRYRDLMMFEERLKQNMIRLKKRQQKYEAFLGSLVVVIAYCAFATFYHPSQTYYVHLLHKFFLLLSATTLFLFFATGMYSEKLGVSSKVLRVFNMHFNRDNRPELSFLRKVPKKFQEEFSAFKVDYFRRKSERRAAAMSGRVPGHITGGSVAMNRTGSDHGRGLHTLPRGRRVAGGGGGGGGSASGSDSGARSTISMSSLNRGDSLRARRPLLRQNSSMTNSGGPSTSSSVIGANSPATTSATSGNK
ncbi:hypothetical protein BGX34_008065 [Mortierella sp. NVP85]|nr:hypothetical protein BGX34_008065 [Mortierella sp. NVP85]